MTVRRALLRVLGAAVSFSFVGASCSQPMLGLMPGVINDPRNLSLRRSLFAEGGGNICEEVKTRSTPFRFHDQDPIVGRFFPVGCSSRRLPTGELYLELSGYGYVWTDLSGKLGFEAQAAVSYDTDFQVDGSTVYAYFRTRGASPPFFYSRFMEQGQGGLVGLLTMGAPGKSMPDRYGSQMMGVQLQRGFTVIRDANGGVATAPGVVPPGGKLTTGAYTQLDPDKATLANERVELRANARDFAGPFKVPAGKRLAVTVSVDGAASIDALIVPRQVGDAWLATYTHSLATTPPPGPVFVDDVIAAGSVYRRSFPVPEGWYFLVFDNTPTAGRSANPPGNPRVIVSYAVQLE